MAAGPTLPFTGKHTRSGKAGNKARGAKRLIAEFKRIIRRAAGSVMPSALEPLSCRVRL